MGKLDGKIAIVVGSSRGIGKGIALFYGREGAQVVVVARSEEQGKLPGTIGQTVEEIKAEGGAAMPLRCDIVQEDDVEAMVQTVVREFGRVDILVNSGAVILHDPIIDTSFKRWELIYRVNVHGAFLLSKAVLRPMMEQRRGNIIQLTSGGSQGDRPGGTHYGSTKAALERFCRGLAAEVKEYNIAINCLEPGAVKTEGRAFTLPPDFDWTGHVEPMDIGPMAVYMGTLDAETVTGAVVGRAEYDAQVKAGARGVLGVVR